MSTKYTPIRWSLIAFLIVMWGLMVIRIGEPWFGHHDANGVFYMTMARNYYLYGASELGFLQLHNYEIPADPENFVFYLHHPPMISWVLGLIGVPLSLTEATSRWAMICATMLFMASFYVLARRLLGQKQAFLALLLFSLTPMIAYFGRMPNHEPLVMAFLMPFITIYAQYLRFPTRARWIALAILAIFSMWTAWAAFFFFAALFVSGIWYRADGDWRKMLVQWRPSLDLIGLMVVIIIATIAVPIFYEIQRPGAINQLLNIMVFRTSSIGGSQGAPEFTFWGYIGQQFLHMITMMTIFVVVMGAVGFIPLRKQPRHTCAMIWGTLAGAMGFLLFFRNASYIHDYYKYYFMPSFALLACLGITWAWKLRRYRWLRPAMMGMVIGSSMYAIVIFVGLHLSSNQPFLRNVALVMKANSTVNDIVMTNLSSNSRSPLIEFYAERRIIYSVAPEDALEQLQETDKAILYIFCQAPLPEELATLPYILVAGDACYLIEMNRDIKEHLDSE